MALNLLIGFTGQISLGHAAFFVSAVIASVMGSLSAHYSGFINPGIANFMMSVELVTMVVLGLLPQMLAGLEGWDTVVFGRILVLTVIFIPRGIVPTIASRFRRIER